MLTIEAATFHGFGCLDELGHGACHLFGANCQLLLEFCTGLLQNLQDHICTSSTTILMVTAIARFEPGGAYPHKFKESSCTCCVYLQYPTVCFSKLFKTHCTSKAGNVPCCSQPTSRTWSSRSMYPVAHCDPNISALFFTSSLTSGWKAAC